MGSLLGETGRESGCIPHSYTFGRLEKEEERDGHVYPRLSL